MKRLLILLLSIYSITSFGQVLLDPSSTPTTSRINDAISQALPSSGTDNYSVSPVGSFSYTYLTGKAISVTFGNTNTGPSTLNFDGLGLKDIKKWSLGSLVSVSAGDLIGTIRLRYDGTQFVMEGGGGYTPGSGTWGSITGTLSSQTDLQTALDTKSEKLLSYVTYTSNHTLSLASDLNKVVIVNTTTGNVSLTIPTNATEAFPAGYQVPIIHIDENNLPTPPNVLTIVASGGVTISASNSSLTSPLAEKGSVFLYADKRLTDTWDLANGIASEGGGGTVTSVGLTTGNAGTDVNVTGSPITTSGTFTLNIPTSSGTNRGALSSSDWTTFNGKQNAITFGTGVQTALGVNIGSAGAPVLFDGALGTPSSGTGTNITGIVGSNVTNTPAGGISATDVQAAINELDTEKENVANKATGFTTLNNTLYPTTQAVSTYVTSLTGGGYTDVAYVNTFSGVDPLGVTDSKTGLQAAMASGKKVIVFDGLYRTTDVLTLNTGQTVLIRGGTVIELYGNVNTGVSLFVMANQSHILAEAGSRLTHTPTGTASYSGIYVDAKYQWSIQGKITIEKFGNQGIRIQGTPSTPNQFRNGIVKDVICRDNINNGFGGASGAGHGIEVTTAEYVFILDVDCLDNAGYGIYFDRAANCPINNTRIISNTLGGLRIDGDYIANTDHFHVSNCQINHNDDVGTFNVHVKDVDTGINFSGCSIYGGSPFKVENSRGVTFTGCGLTTGTAAGTVSVSPGTSGDGIVRINGGHVLYSTKVLIDNITGGGAIQLNNVSETVITPLYTSNFTAGVDSWGATGITATGNVDAISDGNTSFSDVLRMTGDGLIGEHYTNRTALLTVGNRYKAYVTVYIPTANTAAEGLRLSDTGGYDFDFDSGILKKGKWITVEHEFTATGTELRFKATSTATVNFIMPNTDNVYIGRIKIFTL